MTTVEVDGAVPAVAADAMQAAYFRTALEREREHASAQVAKHHAVLARRSDGGSTHGVAHLTSQVRSLEAEIRYLDALIARLDRRFTPSGTERV